MTVDDLWTCLRSLWIDRSTVTVCSFAPIPEPPDDVRPADWRRPIFGNHDATRRRTLAVSRQRAPFLLFVNGDCRLRDHKDVDLALGHLAQGAAAVGGLLVDGDEVAAAGYAFGARGPYPRYVGWSLKNERVQQARPLQAVPGQFLLTTRASWSALNGFTKEFEDRSCWDIDYCLRAGRRGQGYVFYEPAVIVQSPPLAKTDGAGLQLLIALSPPIYDEWQTL